MNIVIHQDSYNYYYITIDYFADISIITQKLNITIKQYLDICKQNNALPNFTVFLNKQDAENTINDLTPYIIAKKLLK